MEFGEEMPDVVYHHIGKTLPEYAVLRQNTDPSPLPEAVTESVFHSGGVTSGVISPVGGGTGLPSAK
jgi:hypothetical protein